MDVIAEGERVRRLGSKHNESLRHLVRVPQRSTVRSGVFISA